MGNIQGEQEKNLEAPGESAKTLGETWGNTMGNCQETGET